MLWTPPGNSAGSMVSSTHDLVGKVCNFSGSCVDAAVDDLDDAIAAAGQVDIVGHAQEARADPAHQSQISRQADSHR